MTNKKLARELRSIGNSLFDTTYDPNNKLLLDEAADRLENQGQWISVDERLPEDQQMVLTIDTEGEMQVCFHETEWEGVFQQFHGLVKIFNISHWMPLPEAPKMKGGAE